MSVKEDRLNRISEATGYCLEDIKAITDAFQDEMKDEILREGKCLLYGFGTFAVHETKGNKHFHVTQREVVAAPDSHSLRFKVSRRFLAEVKAKYDRKRRRRK